MLVLLIGCIGLDSVPGKQDDTASVPVLGTVTLSTGTLDFGDVPVGNESELLLTLTNSSPDMVVVSTTLSGDGVFDIPVTELGLPEGDAYLNVGFAPDAASAFTGVLSFTNEAGESVDVALVGAGTDGSGGGGGGGGSEPDLLVAPNEHNFGTVDIGDTRSVSFDVTNQGGAPLTVTDIVSGDSAFRTGGTLVEGTPLAPGDTRTVEVTFAPTRAQAYTASVTLLSDDPDGPVSIDLSGYGNQACTVCAPIIDVAGGGDPHVMDDFASWFTTDRRTVAIYNLGDTDLRVSSLVVNNDLVATCGTFVVSGFTPGTTVGPGDSTDFTLSYEVTDICYDTSVPDLDSNTLHILSNDPANPDWMIELGGSGAVL